MELSLFTTGSDKKITFKAIKLIVDWIKNQYLNSRSTSYSPIHSEIPLYGGIAQLISNRAFHDKVGYSADFTIGWICTYPFKYDLFVEICSLYKCRKDKTSFTQIDRNRKEPIHSLVKYQTDPNVIKWALQSKLFNVNAVHTTSVTRPIHILCEHQTNYDLVEWVLESNLIELDIDEPESCWNCWRHTSLLHILCIRWCDYPLKCVKLVSILQKKIKWHDKWEQNNTFRHFKTALNKMCIDESISKLFIEIDPLFIKWFDSSIITFELAQNAVRSNPLAIDYVPINMRANIKPTGFKTKPALHITQ
jgi:hypothetical protein